MLALAPLAAFAQLSGSGYYRVQNDVTKRYISIVDTETSISTDGIDLKALHMLKPFEDSVAYNPATICYVELVGSDKCNLIGQGLDLYARTGRVLSYLQRPNGCYWLYGEIGGGVSGAKYLGDESYEEFGPEYTIYYPNDDGANRDWWIYPVTQDESQYFGVKPDITASADGSYWSTMYAGFPFTTSAATTKVYRVSEVDNNLGVAVITEITGNVPTQTPVLFRCTGATPSQNKLTLLSPTTGSVGTNYLNGNYYCNDVPQSSGHRNVKEYSSSTMRMLGTTADGKPAFVKSDIKYLPANKCFLAVSSSAPAELLIMTEEEYQQYVTGIDQITVNGKGSEKVIYDLQGRRVQTPAKGIYIVNGKKVVIK